jgi:hypothetical protein
MAATKATGDSLRDRLDLESAEGWNPEEGDTLIGAVISIKASSPNEYGIYPIVTVATENGNVAVHCFHSILKNALLEARPAVGERIAIAYLGMKHSKKNDRPYANYSVVVDRPQADSTDGWDSFVDTDTTDPED